MKKLSTFLMMSLLAGAVGTVHAAVVYASYGTAPTNVTEIKTNGLYQLVDASNNAVLMEEKDGKFVLNTAAAGSGAGLKSTLWTITAKNDGVGNYSYTFVNYGTGLPLAIDPAGSAVAKDTNAPTAAIEVGGSVGSWKWVAAPSASAAINLQTVCATFGAKADSIVYLMAGTSVVGAMKQAASAAAPTSNVLKIKPAAPAAVLLGKDDLNSMLWTEGESSGVKFTFDKDVQGSSIGNLFTSQAYAATDAVGYPFENWTAPTGTISAETMNLTAKTAYELAIHKAELAKDVAAALGSTDEKIEANGALAYGFVTKMTYVSLGSPGTVEGLLENLAGVTTSGKSGEEKTMIEKVRAAIIKFVKAEGYQTIDENFVGLFNTEQLGFEAPVNGITYAAAYGGYGCQAGKSAVDAGVKHFEDLAKEAKDAMTVEETSNRQAIGTNGWLSLVAANGKYLMVDTAYLTSAPGSEMLGFATKTFKDVTTNSNGIALANNNKTRLDLNGRFNFQFLWYPENDSISVRVAGYSKLSDGKTKYYRDMDLTSLKNPAVTKQMNGSTTANAEQNLVKLTYLTNTHSEVTIGNSAYAGANNWTVNTKITINGASKYTKTTVDEGVYLIQYVSDLAKNKENNGKYYVAGILNSGFVKMAEEDMQNFADMPSAQWIVTKDKYTDRYTIVNREDSTQKISGFDNAYIYAAGDNQISLLKGDTVRLTKLTGDAVTSQNVGYFGGSNESMKETKFALNYFNAIDDTKFVNMTKDSTLAIDIDGEKLYFSFDSIGYTKIHIDKKGVDGKVFAKGIKKNKYQLYVAEKNAPEADRLYVFKDGNGYRLNTKAAAGATAKPDSFYIVEWNSKTSELKAEVTTKYYALFDAEDAGTKVGVKDINLALTNESINEVRTSTFALVEEPAPLYRRLGATIKDGINDMDTAYVEMFLAKEPTRFLYENSQNRVADNGTKMAADSLNYLGVYNKADLERNAALFVDTAYVRNETNKPLYMLASSAVYTPAGNKKVVCPQHGDSCEHATKDTTFANVTGRYLVALNDSTNNKSAYYQAAPRLAFVDAIHANDSLYVGAKKFALKKGDMNDATFAFRLVDDGDEADFYIEAKGGQYVRIHNGVPVLVKTLSEAATFNVKKTAVKPTANEEIAADGVKVIAGEGFVTVKGAAGKKVVVANILGQTVANTVVSSDEAQIAAPAGVVVVAVEGEAAVKAIVK